MCEAKNLWVKPSETVTADRQSFPKVIFVRSLVIAVRKVTYANILETSKKNLAE